MRRLKSSKGTDRADVIVACEEALAYMNENGLPEQQELLANNPVEPHWKPQKPTSKRDKPRRQISGNVSDDEPTDARSVRPKGKGKSKRERTRSLSPSRKRNGPDDRGLEDLPKPKKAKAMSRRKSTGSSLAKKPAVEKPAKKPGPSKREKSKVKAEEPPSDGEKGAVKSDREEPVPRPGRRPADRAREMDVDRVKEEDKKAADVAEEKGEEGEDTKDDEAAMEIEPAAPSAPRHIPTLDSRYIDKIAGMEKPDVDHILKKAPPVSENRVPADSDENVSVEIAQQVCDTVVNGAASYLKDSRRSSAGGTSCRRSSTGWAVSARRSCATFACSTQRTSR